MKISTKVIKSENNIHDSKFGCCLYKNKCVLFALSRTKHFLPTCVDIMKWQKNKIKYFGFKILAIASVTHLCPSTTKLK